MGDITETSNEEQAEENAREDIHVYQRRSNISSKAIFLFTPAFEVYQRTIIENGKATALGEQEAAQCKFFFILPLGSRFWTCY